MLPPGIYSVNWLEFTERFGNSPRRKQLLDGLLIALRLLQSAGCGLVFVDGSFVTAKHTPGDYDACWGVKGVDPDLLNPVFLNFDNGRAAQKERFAGEFFPAELPEGESGQTFLDFFQTNKDDGSRKGIVCLNLDILDLDE